MELPTASEFFSALLQPSLPVILFSVAVALLLPILLHLTLYRQAASKSLPTFLIAGPSGAGKTSLLTLLETGTPAATRTSQTPQTAVAALPADHVPASGRYRAAADPTLRHAPQLQLIDTPGHGKLRRHVDALLASTASPPVTGVIFLIDAADLPAYSAQIRAAAQFLHDVLLNLQRRQAPVAARGGPPFPVLLAANKSDLFTALPASMVQKALELEISEVRTSRETGLLDAGASDDAEREWLGEGGDGVFAFDQMRDAGIEVSVVGIRVEGAEGPDVAPCWEWIAACM